ncbi:unnamed protein product, partial [Nesidiocoris tenuis]
VVSSVIADTSSETAFPKSPGKIIQMSLDESQDGIRSVEQGQTDESARADDEVYYYRYTILTSRRPLCWRRRRASVAMSTSSPMTSGPPLPLPMLPPDLPRRRSHSACKPAFSSSSSLE